MVEVRLMQRTDRTLFYEVVVGSEIKPWVLLKGEMEFAGDTEAATCQKVGLLAGALAEGLCERYSDTLDPTQCAQAGMDAYRDLLKDNPHLRMGGDLSRGANGAIATSVARH